MTKLLARALKKMKALPGPEQDAIASLVLEELEDERRWEKAFAKSGRALRRLGEEAAAEHRAKKTKPLDPERL
jgi:hypothetical protein